VFGKKRSNVISNFVTIEVLNQQLFSSAGQISSPRDLNVLFVIVAFFSCFLCDDVRFIRPLIQPLVVGYHLSFQPLDVDTNQGVMAPDLSLRFIGWHGTLLVLGGDRL